MKRILIILIITILSGALYNNYDNKKIFNAKLSILKDEIKENKISEENKSLIELKESKEKTKKEIWILNKKIMELDLNLSDKRFLEECIRIQIDRIVEWKEVIKWYCSQELQKHSSQKDKKIIDTITPNINLKASKENLFTCIEVKNEFWLKSDAKRCATYLTIVKAFESNFEKSNMCKNYNNCFWLKVPTDKKWLKWNWSAWKWNFIKFDTKEIWNYAFAYYYLNYHTNKTANKFVNTYSDWNKNYIKFILNNYDKLYWEYNI